MLSQLAWFDEEFQEHDPEVRELIAKGREFHAGRPGADGRESSGDSGHRCCRRTGGWRRRGQIEISTTPFYHPILPLLCDSDIAGVSHPGVPLPPRFRYPEDARRQLRAGARVHQRDFRGGAGRAVAVGRLGLRRGLSPSPPRRASNGPPPIAACSTARCGSAASLDELYRPYQWQQNGRADAGDLPRSLPERSDRLRLFRHGRRAKPPTIFCTAFARTAAGILASGRDALVPIILDGENAWEYYDRNGRPFLRELYRASRTNRDMEAVTVSEALRANRRRSRSITSSRAPGSTPTSTSGSAPRRTTRPGSTCCARGRPMTTPPMCPRSSEAAGVRRTADRRRQRLVLVVWAGARFGQSRRIRPALSQPSGQCLSRAPSGAAGGALAADPEGGRGGVSPGAGGPSIRSSTAR